eukprot:m.93806 g.93806  ORF g.93806 m.93806 type:complete len:76 (+) comp14990_c0_seq1:827-1054(+)
MVTDTSVLLVGATLPDRGKKSIMTLLQHRLPSLEVIASPRLHRTVPRLEQQFVRLPADTVEARVRFRTLVSPPGS